MALIDNLIAYWPLNEASGNARVDLHSSGMTMSEDGGSAVATAAGLVYSLAADISGDTASPFDYLSNNSASPLELSGERTIAIWTYIDVFEGSFARAFMQKGSASATEWRISHVSATSTIDFVVTATGGTVNVTGVSTAAWHLLIGRYDPAAGANGTIYLSIDDGAEVSAALSSAITTAGTRARIGSSQHDSFNNRLVNARIGPVVAWSRVLSAAERSQVWNGGNGLTYAQMIATPYLAFPRWGSVRR